MPEPDPARLTLVGRALEVFVVWARLLDSHKGFPFGELQLTRAQLEALFFIAHAPVAASPSTLAQALGVTRGAVTQLMAGLVEAGLVEQRHDQHDARRKVLVLSAESRARVAGFEKDLATRLASRFALLDDDELRLLTGLLDRTKQAW